MVLKMSKKMYTESYIADSIFPHQVYELVDSNNLLEDVKTRLEWCEVAFDCKRWSLENEDSCWYHYCDTSARYRSSPHTANKHTHSVTRYALLNKLEFHFKNEDDKILYALKWLS